MNKKAYIQRINKKLRMNVEETQKGRVLFQVSSIIGKENHSEFLSEQMAVALINRYGTVPSPEAFDVLLGIAKLTPEEFRVMLEERQMRMSMFNPRLYPLARLYRSVLKEDMDGRRRTASKVFQYLIKEEILQKFSRNSCEEEFLKCMDEIIKANVEDERPLPAVVQVHSEIYSIPGLPGKLEIQNIKESNQKQSERAYGMLQNALEQVDLEKAIVGAFSIYLKNNSLYSMVIFQMALVYLCNTLYSPFTIDNFFPSFTDDTEKELILSETETIITDLENPPLIWPEIKKLPVRTSTIISSFARKAFSGPVYISPGICKLFMKKGRTEREARDYAVIIGTLEQAAKSEADYRYDYYTIDNKPQEVTVAITEAENSDKAALDITAQPEYIALEGKYRELVQNEKSLYHELQAVKHELMKLEEEHEKTVVQLQESRRVISSMEQTMDEMFTHIATERVENAQFPFHTRLRVVLFGGFDSFQRKILSYLPDIRVIQGHKGAELAPVQKADMVFLQTNNCSHATYWRVCEAIRNRGIPYYHLNNASAKVCAEQMLALIQTMEQNVS